MTESVTSVARARGQACFDFSVSEVSCPRDDARKKPAKRVRCSLPVTASTPKDLAPKTARFQGCAASLDSHYSYIWDIWGGGGGTCETKNFEQTDAISSFVLSVYMYVKQLAVDATDETHSGNRRHPSRPWSIGASSQGNKRAKQNGRSRPRDRPSWWTWISGPRLEIF